MGPLTVGAAHLGLHVVAAIGAAGKAGITTSSAAIDDVRQPPIAVAAKVQARIDRLAVGNPGQSRTLTGGVAEMKVDFGPGYRVYYTQRGALLVVPLCGGDKGTQRADIKTAPTMAQDLE